MGQGTKGRTPIIINVTPNIHVNSVIENKVRIGWGIRFGETSLKEIHGDVDLWLQEVRDGLDLLVGSGNYELTAKELGVVRDIT